jgi:hypothetical protein
MIRVPLQYAGEILDDPLVLAGRGRSLSGQSAPVPKENRCFLQALGRPSSKPASGDKAAQRQFTQDMPATEQMREPPGVG